MQLLWYICVRLPSWHANFVCTSRSTSLLISSNCAVNTLLNWEDFPHGPSRPHQQQKNEIMIMVFQRGPSGLQLWVWVTHLWNCWSRCILHGQGCLHFLQALNLLRWYAAVCTCIDLYRPWAVNRVIESSGHYYSYFLGDFSSSRPPL